MDNLNQPGKSLRQAREAAGLSVSDVVHQTKFPRTVIEALERDDYTVFSSPTYAKSYLSQYAEFVGIDSAKWLDFFEPAAFAAPQDMLSMIESPAHQEIRATGTPSRGGSSSLLPTVLLIVLSVGLIYGVIRGYAYFEQRFAEPVALKEASPAQSNNPAPTNSTPGQAPAVAPPVNTVSTQPLPEATPPPRATIVDE
ncbi:MAG: hypothetical protein CFE26_08965 [Verrucomicrobiales bacterium VVV1]|nr:MAG: hypothetical protein CFE26_08965 [Verrucomicrobiales bacterium VVV1]